MTVRGCGTRVAGGAYLCTGVSEDGFPVERFLVDPPIPVPASLRLTPIGVKLCQQGPYWHVLDWIGSRHYPNVADVVEEARRYGISRRISRQANFTHLGPQSHLILAHRRAVITNHQAWYTQLHAEGRPRVACPTHHRDHPPHRQALSQCAGLWWYDLEGAVVDQEDHWRMQRPMTAYSYRGWTPPNCPALRALGMFMSLPIQRIVVIRDPVAGTHEQVVERVSMGKLPVVEEDA